MLNIEQLKALHKVCPKNDICDYINGIYVDMSNPSYDTYWVTDKHHLIGFKDTDKIINETNQPLDHIFLPYAGIKAFIGSNKWSKYLPERVTIVVTEIGDIRITADNRINISIGNALSASQKELKYPKCQQVFDKWLADSTEFDTKENGKNLGLFTSKTMGYWELYQGAFKATKRKILSANGNLITIDSLEDGTIQSFFLGSQLVPARFY